MMFQPVGQWLPGWITGLYSLPIHIILFSESPLIFRKRLYTILYSKKKGAIRIKQLVKQTNNFGLFILQRFPTKRQ